MLPPRQTLTFLRRRFKEVGVELSKRHGQNFLIDLNLLDLLAEKADIQPNDVVLEVGTGTGGLTALLAAKAAHVITVEIDPRMHQLASEELIDFANVTLLNQDALAGKNHMSPEILTLVKQHLTAEPGRRFKVAANLPYCVATPIISNLLLDEPLPATMTVTIQKELGERITAVRGTKDYSALSIWVQSQCAAELVRVLPPSVFWPRPKVDSAIIHLTYMPERRAMLRDVAGFHDFVRALFLYRRKSLRAALVNLFKGRMDKPAVDRLLAELNFGESARAEELTVEELLRLFEHTPAGVKN